MMPFIDGLISILKKTLRYLNSKQIDEHTGIGDVFGDYDGDALGFEHNRIVKRLFFELLFSMLGKIARVDGLVSLDEIEFTQKLTRDFKFK